MDALSIEPADEPGLTHYLRDSATWAEIKEFFANRSIYHLKEADPHAWVHSTLFANLLLAANMDSSYLGLYRSRTGGRACDGELHVDVWAA